IVLLLCFAHQISAMEFQPHTHALQAQNPRSVFARINEETQAFEVRVADYINDKGIKISLLSMIHIGEKSFYENSKKRIHGKTLLFEGMGDRYDEGVIGEQFSQLDEYHRFKLKIIERLLIPYALFAESRGLELQAKNLDQKALITKRSIKADLSSEEIGNFASDTSIGRASCRERG